jgi:hypothetical protein
MSLPSVPAQAENAMAVEGAYLAVEHSPDMAQKLKPRG